MFESMAKIIKETHTLYVMILCFFKHFLVLRNGIIMTLLCTLPTMVSSFLNSRVRVPTTSLLT